MAVVNLADPSFEPTDEQLTELSSRAFADVKQKHERSLRAMRIAIAAGRAELLKRLGTREQ